jgi:hypothetical protein
MLLFEHGVKGLHPAVLLLADHSKEKLLLAVEIGVERSAPE